MTTDFFDRAEEAAERVEAFLAVCEDERLSGQVCKINDAEITSEHLGLLTKALREAIALNRGIRAESAGLKQRLSALESGQERLSHTETLAQAASALEQALSRVKQVMRANDPSQSEPCSCGNPTKHVLTGERP